MDHAITCKRTMKNGNTSPTSLVDRLAFINPLAEAKRKLIRKPKELLLVAGTRKSARLTRQTHFRQNPSGKRLLPLAFECRTTRINASFRNSTQSATIKLLLTTNGATTKRVVLNRRPKKNQSIETSTKHMQPQVDSPKTHFLNLFRM